MDFYAVLIIGLLAVIVLVLWWIRAALEPLRDYFQGRLLDREDAADSVVDDSEA